MIDYRKYDLIRKPVITEKATLLAEQDKYLFEVSKDANKAGVKGAVESIFQVKVKSVNVLVTKGKVKRFKGRLGQRSDLKKAIVTLESGYTIDLAGGIK